MFSNTQMSAINLGFPDVCKTLIALATVPIPYPNIAPSTTCIPNIFNVFIQCMPSHNLMTLNPMSSGDEPGVLLGVASNLIKGPVQHMIGSFKVFKQVMPATKMLSMTGHNGVALNIPGLTLSPSQLKELILG